MIHPIFDENHICHGKSCTECETCIFDEPIQDDTTAKILPTCNQCGYLVRSYQKNGTLNYNAHCGKYHVNDGNTDLARVIQRNVCGINAPIYQPDWCPMEIAPKRVLALPVKVNTYDEYVEKRKKMEALPSICDWKKLQEGDMCIVPRILRQKRRLLLIKSRSEFVLKCVQLDDNLEPSSTVVNIYSNDIDTKFIVKIHKF